MAGESRGHLKTCTCQDCWKLWIRTIKKAEEKASRRMRTSRNDEMSEPGDEVSDATPERSENEWPDGAPF